MERDGHLVGDQVFAAQPRQDAVANRTADEERHGHFTEALVRHSDDRCVIDCRRQAQHLFHGVGEHLVAAAVDEVTGPALDPHEAVVVDASEVARVDEPVGVDPLGNADSRCSAAARAGARRRRS